MEQTSRRRHINTLQMVAHKNKQQILYYITQAKIQIYAHCIIAYDPKFFVNLPLIQRRYNIQNEKQSKINNKNTNNIVNNKQSNKVAENSKNKKVSFHQSSQISQQNIDIAKTKKAEQQNSEQIEKNQDLIENKFQHKSIMQKFYALAPTYHTSQLVLQNSKQISQKILYFNNSDLAFYVQEPERIIEIHNLSTKQVQIRFKVNNEDTLMTVQSLFRRKLCQLGFQKKYTKIKVLGKGATAEVYLVLRNYDKKSFAAKIISIKDAGQKQFQLFVNQAKLLRILKHKNIIGLQSVYIDKKQLIQVLQYLPGGTLLDCLKNTKNPMNLGQKWRVLKDITNALQYMRKRRIVHRDLKLQNVMVRVSSQSNQYVVSDFGLACWMGEKNLIYQKCGTPGYIAPQILNLPADVNIVDHRCDIFSLGVIAHLLFLHQPLFHYKGSLRELIQQNKLANFNLQGKKYRYLRSQQLTFLTLTLQRKIQSRITSQQLLKFMNSIVIQIPKKSSTYRTPRRHSLQPESSNVQVKIKKQASMTKKAIKIDLNRNQDEKTTNFESEIKSPKKTFFTEARRTVSQFFEQLTTPKNNRVQRYKVKQNSIQKQKNMKQFFKDN